MPVQPNKFKSAFVLIYTHESREQISLRYSFVDLLRNKAQLHAPAGFLNLVACSPQTCRIRGAWLVHCTYHRPDILAWLEDLEKVWYARCGGFFLFIIRVLCVILTLQNVSELTGYLSDGNMGEELVWQGYDERKWFHGNHLSEYLHADSNTLETL